MKHQMKKRCHSGFTLLEMVVVLAIIAILLGVMLPNMHSYLVNSRLSTANSQAKVFYNSIQTIMQEYEFKERQMSESLFYGPDTKEGFVFMRGINGTIDQAESFKVAKDGKKPDFSVATASIHSNATDFKYTDASSDEIGTSLSTAGAATIGSRLSRLYSDYSNVSWAVYIYNYSVRGVLCADESNSDYVGGYPRKATMPVTDPGCETGEKSLNAVEASDMREYCKSAWTSGS
ncbi:MAG: type II secretion system protein [Oscillospiraceae bacterium]|nr:type II secretion system protein [Oscillospiraceae bacterium]